MDLDAQPAEARGDYRFFRWFALNGARLVVACLFLIGWNLVTVLLGRPWNSATLLFLGNTGLLALVVSLVSGTVSYQLFKRRGGKVEKTPPPLRGG